MSNGVSVAPLRYKYRIQTNGPTLDILVQSMATVTLVFAPLFLRILE